MEDEEEYTDEQQKEVDMLLAQRQMEFMMARKKLSKVDIIVYPNNTFEISRDGGLYIDYPIWAFEKELSKYGVPLDRHKLPAEGDTVFLEGRTVKIHMYPTKKSSQAVQQYVSQITFKKTNYRKAKKDETSQDN